MVVKALCRPSGVEYPVYFYWYNYIPLSYTYCTDTLTSVFPCASYLEEAFICTGALYEFMYNFVNFLLCVIKYFKISYHNVDSIIIIFYICVGNSSNITIKHFIIMARKHGISHLSVQIRYSRVQKCYRIVIDGDVFWSDTYEHAVIELMKILLSDEFTHSKIC